MNLSEASKRIERLEEEIDRLYNILEALGIVLASWNEARKRKVNVK
jgi:hypothetical protein